MYDKLLVAGVLCCVATTVTMALPPRVPEGSMDLYEAGRFPLSKGTVKPLDSLARNALQVISNRETFKDDDGKKSRPAIRWLFDVISEVPRPSNIACSESIASMSCPAGTGTAGAAFVFLAEIEEG